MVDFKTLNKEEEQVNKVGPPVEALLLEAPPQGSSSSKANRGKHGTRDGQPPATIATTKIKIGRLCSSTSISGHLVEQPQ
jgi:hypothetical protein